MFRPHIQLMITAMTEKVIYTLSLWSLYSSEGPGLTLIGDYKGELPLDVKIDKKEGGSYTVVQLLRLVAAMCEEQPELYKSVRMNIDAQPQLREFFELATQDLQGRH